MRQNIALFLVILFLTACSEYPTSGGLDLNEVKKHIDGDVKVDQSYGLVVEFDHEVLEVLKEIKWHELDLEEVRKDKTHQPNLNTSHEGIDEVKKALAGLLNVDQAIRDTISQSMAEWKTQLQIIQPIVNQAHQETKAVYDQYYGYIKEPQEKWNQVNQQKSDLEGQLSEIAQAIAKEANRVIMDQQLPIPKLDESNYKFQYQILGWNDGLDISGVDCSQPRKTSPQVKTRRQRLGTANPGMPITIRGEYAGSGGSRFKKGHVSYPESLYAIYDQRSDQRQCVYIKRPVENLDQPEFEQFLSNKLSQYISTEDRLSVVTTELATAEKALAQAHIVAQNQTGINFKKLKKELDQLTFMVDGLNWVLSDKFTVDTFFVNGEVNDAQYNQVFAINRSLTTFLKGKNKATQGQVIGSLFNDIRPDPLEKFRLDSEAKQQYDMAVTQYLSKVKRKAIADHIVAKTVFDDDCTFSGLNGSADYVVTVAKCKINGREGAMRHFFDMTPEKHEYQEMSDLWLNPKATLLIEAKYVTPDNIDHLVMTALESGLFKQLNAVRSAYEKGNKANVDGT